MQDVMDEKGLVLFDNLAWFAKKLCWVMTSDERKIPLHHFYH